MENNTIIATAGGHPGEPYLIQVSVETVGSTINGVLVESNYVDPAGTFGVFYPTATGSNLSFVNTVNMVTGSQVSAPSVGATYSSNVKNVVASPASGTENPGNTLTLTVNLNEKFNVAGTPTLTLNTGGKATYVSGSGTNALTFSYTVGNSDATVAQLAITQVNTPSGTTITDSVGNNANLAGALVSFPGLAVDPPDTLPTETQVIATPGSGVAGVGTAITLNVGLNEAVQVVGGTPTLALNNGGTATYDARATEALGNFADLLFDYTVASTDASTPALAIAGVNLNGATIQDAAGHSADLSGVTATLTGLAIAAASFASPPTNGMASGDLASSIANSIGAQSGLNGTMLAATSHP